ncbi:MAG: squalene/phytoene synthase family protein [Elusimicrobia bacterium]|nr:squalene/phytoene synthase family protein [Elusimicrobiota bacterium]
MYELLRGVSRSLYLSLRLLPAVVREPISLAYLFCRAADTIVDAKSLPYEQRFASLRMFRKPFETSSSPDAQEILAHLGAVNSASPSVSEQRLLAHLGRCFEWFGQLEEPYPRFIRKVVLSVTQGMAMDLEVFRNGTSKQPRALGTLQELDQYCFYIGGAPGEFWTNVGLAGLPALHKNGAGLIEQGIRFGKGLQLTNILRDLATDLRLGRCYLPGEMLERVGLSARHLLETRAWPAVRPVLNELMGIALTNLDQGKLYVQALSRREGRFRLAVTWPLFIAVETLRLIADSSRLLDPTVRIKVSRPRLYQLLLRSLPAGVSNRSFGAQYDRLREGLQKALRP